MFQDAEVDHRRGRHLGVAGGDGLLVPVPGLAGVPFRLFQDAELEHRPRRLVGVAGGDGLLIPVPGLAEVPVHFFQDAEFDHCPRRHLGVAGGDGLLPPVAAACPFSVFIEKHRDLAVRMRVDRGVGVAEQARGGLIRAAG